MALVIHKIPAHRMTVADAEVAACLKGQCEHAPPGFGPLHGKTDPRINKACQLAATWVYLGVPPGDDGRGCTGGCSFVVPAHCKAKRRTPFPRVTRECTIARPKRGQGGRYIDVPATPHLRYGRLPPVAQVLRNEGVGRPVCRPRRPRGHSCLYQSLRKSCPCLIRCPIRVCLLRLVRLHRSVQDLVSSFLVTWEYR